MNERDTYSDTKKHSRVKAIAAARSDTARIALLSASALLLSLLLLGAGRLIGP